SKLMISQARPPAHESRPGLDDRQRRATCLNGRRGCAGNSTSYIAQFRSSGHSSTCARVSNRRGGTMRPIERTVWYVESHLNMTISLDDVAQIAGLSKFALTRTFRATTGHTVLAYVRARRMSEAAKSLQRGATSILDVALSVGYGSHEAFSRAF